MLTLSSDFQRKTRSVPRFIVFKVKTDACPDCWLCLAAKAYKPPRSVYFLVLQSSIYQPKSICTKCRAVPAQSLLAQNSCHKRQHTHSSYRPETQVAWRTWIVFLTLQQWEKIWQMYSCVYRDLLSSAMRWEIIVASCKQGERREC